MKRTPVTSSTLKSIGYDPKNQKLEIEFKSGGLYTYDDVDQDTFDKLMHADSLGRHHANHVKGKFKHKKVGGK